MQNGSKRVIRPALTFLFTSFMKRYCAAEIYIPNEQDHHKSLREDNRTNFQEAFLSIYKAV